MVQEGKEVPSERPKDVVSGGAVLAKGEEEIPHDIVSGKEIRLEEQQDDNVRTDDLIDVNPVTEDQQEKQEEKEA